LEAAVHSKKVAAPLAEQQIAVYPAGGSVGGGGTFDIDKTFVVAKVEVGLRTIPGNKDFTVLVGGHGAGVDIEIGVQFHDGDTDTAAFEDVTDGGDGDAFTYRAYNAASDKNVFWHNINLY